VDAGTLNILNIFFFFLVTSTLPLGWLTSITSTLEANFPIGNPTDSAQIDLLPLYDEGLRMSHIGYGSHGPVVIRTAS
jgi:hypothetical protein